MAPLLRGLRQRRRDRGARRKLARDLFGAGHAYLQPHSGADANLVAFLAILATRVESRLLDRLEVKNVRRCRTSSSASCGPS